MDRLAGYDYNRVALRGNMDVAECRERHVGVVVAHVVVGV